MKSFIDTCITAICFYVIGYAFSFGNRDNTNGECCIVGVSMFGVAGYEVAIMLRMWNNATLCYII